MAAGTDTTSKIAIEPGSVQETLIIPLYGRKLCAEVFPRLYNDTSAAELCSRLDYDFSSLDKQAKSTFWRFGALEAAMRCDNGTCLMYNVDMPDIIAARNELIGEVDRERNIACDLNDTRWMDEVDGSGGAIFFAAGVFHYFTFAQAKALTNALAERFGGCRIVFDTIGKLGRRLMRSTFKSFGMENYDECLCVEDVSELRGWVPGARVSSRGYMLGYYSMDDPAVTGLHRFLALLGDRTVKMQIVRMDVAG